MDIYQNNCQKHKNLHCFDLIFWLFPKLVHVSSSPTGVSGYLVCILAAKTVENDKEFIIVNFNRLFIATNLIIKLSRIRFHIIQHIAANNWVVRIAVNFHSKK